MRRNSRESCQHGGRLARKAIFLNLVRIAVLLGALFWTVFEGWRYEGVFRFFAELEVSVFGSYEALVTGVLTWGVFVIPGALFIRLTERALGFKPGQAPLLGAGVAPDRFRAGRRKYLFPILGVTLILGGALPGGFFLWKSRVAGRCRAIDLADFYQGRETVPDGQYVSVKGDAAFQESILVERTFGTSAVPLRYHDFPLRPPRQEDATVRLIVEAADPFPFTELVQAPNPLTVKGILTHQVPGFLRARLEDEGVNLSASAAFLQAGESPEDMASLGTALLAGFGTLGIIVLLGWGIVRLRRHSLAKVTGTEIESRSE